MKRLSDEYLNSQRWQKSSDEWVETMNKSRDRKKQLEMQQGYRLKEMKRRLDQKFRKLGQDLSEGIYAGREGAFQKQQEKLYKEAKRFEELADRLGL